MPDNVISLEKLTISNADILKMNPEMKRQYFMFTNMLQDLNLLQKLLLFVKIEDKNEISKAAFLPPSLFVLRTLIGKIVEICVFIESKNTGILSHRNDYPDETKKALEKIELFFNDKTRKEKTKDLFEFIRDKLIFHYDTWLDIPGRISAFMDSRSQGMDMWLCVTDSGNDIFSSTNEIMLGMIFQKMVDNGFVGDKKILMDRLVTLTIDIAGDMREFCVQYLTGVILKGVTLEPKDKKEISVPFLSKVNLSLLVKNDISTKLDR